MVPHKWTGEWTDGSSHQVLEWRLTWRTIFTLARHAHLGNPPGMVSLDGPAPRNTWIHDFPEVR